MKVIEIMKLGRNILETLQSSCIRISDLKYIDMYDDYERIMQSGEKTTYAAAVLTEKYGISERQFYYLIRKLSTDCKSLAAG